MTGLKTMVNMLIKRFAAGVTAKRAAGISLLIFLALASSRLMAQATAVISNQVVTLSGVPAPYATVRICPYGASGVPCTPLSSLYADVAETIPLPNPLTTDQNGWFSAFVSGSSFYLMQTNPTSTTIYSSYQNGGSSGTITTVTATSPLVSSGGTTPNISLPQATTSSNGWLSSTDWNTFNAKATPFTLTTSGTSGAATYIGNVLNIPQYSSGGGGGIGSGTIGQIPMYTGTTALGPAPEFLDASQYSTLALACAAAYANNSTLLITTPWTAVPAQTCQAPNIQFYPGGSIQPASLAKFYFTSAICPADQICFDTTAGGAFYATQQHLFRPENFAGATPDNQFNAADNTTINSGGGTLDASNFYPSTDFAGEIECGSSAGVGVHVLLPASQFWHWQGLNSTTTCAVRLHNKCSFDGTGPGDQAGFRMDSMLSNTVIGPAQTMDGFVCTAANEVVGNNPNWIEASRFWIFTASNVTFSNSDAALTLAHMWGNNNFSQIGVLTQTAPSCAFYDVSTSASFDSVTCDSSSSTNSMPTTIIGKVGLNHVTGISGSGLAGPGYVTLSNFNNGCAGSTATVQLDSSGNFLSAVTNLSGNLCSYAPTSATCASGTATCPATVTITSTLTGSYTAGLWFRNLQTTHPPFGQYALYIQGNNYTQELSFINTYSEGPTTQLTNKNTVPYIRVGSGIGAVNLIRTTCAEQAGTVSDGAYCVDVASGNLGTSATNTTARNSHLIINDEANNVQITSSTQGAGGYNGNATWLPTYSTNVSGLPVTSALSPAYLTNANLLTNNGFESGGITATASGGTTSYGGSWAGYCGTGASCTYLQDGTLELASVTGVSGGGGFSGSGTILLTNFNNGCSGATATVTLSSGSFSSAVITGSGSSCTSPPTTATCTSGTATCTGSPVTITVVTTTAANAVTGSYSQELTMTGGSYASVYQGSINVTSGQQYILSFWMKGDGGSEGVTVRLINTSNTNQYCAGVVSVKSTTVWTYYSTPCVSSATDSGAGMTMFIDAPGTVWIDDMFISSQTSLTYPGFGAVSQYSSALTSFAAPSGSWPTWLVPTVTNSTTTPSLAVAASAVPTSVGGLGANNGSATGVPVFASGTATVTATTGSGSPVAAVSPALTGSPTAPTQTAGDNSTKIATTAYVATAVTAVTPTVTFAGGDLICARGSDTGIASTAITGGTATSLTVGSLPPAFVVGSLVGVTGASPAGLNTSGTSYYAVTSVVSNTLNFASLGGTWSSGGTIFLGCANTSDAAGNYVYASYNAPTLTPAANATYSNTVQFAEWTTATAPSLIVSSNYGTAGSHTVIFNCNFSNSLPTSQSGGGGQVTWDLTFPSSTSVIATQKSLLQSGAGSCGPSTKAPVAISGSKTLLTGFNFTATGIGIPTYSSGGTPTGTGTCVVAASGGGGSNGQLTVNVSSGAVTGFTMLNTGYGYTSEPTSWTYVSGSACSTTITTTGGSLGGAQGNAILVQASKLSQ